MNGLGRKDNGDKDKKPSILTSETLGVVLVLFATLCLVCLITRETVFSAPGQYINWFFLGCFGWFSYAVLAWVIVTGVILITGKTTGLSKKKKGLITLCFVLASLLIHVISMREYSDLTYGEYLKKCYMIAEDGFVASSAGGFFIGIFAYLFSSLLTNVGSYVVVGIALVSLTVYTIKEFMEENPAQKTADSDKFRSSFVKNVADEKVPASVEIEGVRDYPVSGVDFSADSSKQKLFVNKPEDFTMRTKREIAKDKGDTAIKFGFAENGLGVASPAQGVKEVKPVTYSDDFKNKLDYIKTPVAINIESISGSNYGTVTPKVTDTYTAQTTVVSDYVSSRPPIEE